MANHVGSSRADRDRDHPTWYAHAPRTCGAPAHNRVWWLPRKRRPGGLALTPDPADLRQPKGIARSLSRKSLGSCAPARSTRSRIRPDPGALRSGWTAASGPSRRTLCGLCFSSDWPSQLPCDGLCWCIPSNSAGRFDHRKQRSGHGTGEVLRTKAELISADPGRTERNDASGSPGTQARGRIELSLPPPLVRSSVAGRMTIESGFQRVEPFPLIEKQERAADHIAFVAVVAGRDFLADQVFEFGRQRYDHDRPTKVLQRLSKKAISSSSLYITV